MSTWARGRTVTALAAAAAGLLTLHAHGGGAPVVASANAPVATAPGWVDVTGGLRRLGVGAPGIVTDVPVSEDDSVSGGAVLLRLDDRDERLEQEAANVEVARERRKHSTLADALARAREAASRLAPLVAQQSEPADELRRARATVADLESRRKLAELAVHAAELRAALARRRVEEREVRAPSRGKVLRLVAHPGDAVSPGVPLVWFAPEGPRVVRAELDERFFGRVRAGMRAEVRPEYDDTRVYTAAVLRVADLVGPVRGLPEVHPAARDDRVVECVLALGASDLRIGQRVLVRILEVR